jgi:hypothetical protein
MFNKLEKKRFIVYNNFGAMAESGLLQLVSMKQVGFLPSGVQIPFAPPIRLKVGKKIVS